MLIRVFWAFFAVVVGELIWIYWGAAPTRGTHRALAFFVMCIPPGLLALLAAVVILSRSRAAIWVGLFLLAIPVLQIVIAPLHSARIRREVERTSAGDDRFTAPRQRELAHAIAAGDLALVKTLIPAAGNLNEPGEAGATLLHFAIGKSSGPGAPNEIVKALLEAGADPNLPSYGTGWPLELALCRRDLAVILLDAGANPNIIGSDSRPLWWRPLALNLDSQVETLTALVEHGVDLSLKDPEGMNPVSYAAWHGGWRQMWMMIELGVEWRQQQVWGRPVEDVVLAGLRDAEMQHWTVPEELRKAAALMSGAPQE